MNTKQLTLIALATAFLVVAGFSDRAEAAYPQTREYLLGNIDGFAYEGPGSADDVYVDPDFLAFLQAVAPGESNDDFDVLNANNNVPFTFLFPLDPGEEVVAATLSLGLRATESLVSSDELGFRSPDGTAHWKYRFSDLGWLPLPNTGTHVRTVDLWGIWSDPQLTLLQEGSLNVYVTDDCAVDYATLTLEVVPEPATLSLLAVVGAAFLRRRNR